MSLLGAAMHQHSQTMSSPNVNLKNGAFAGFADFGTTYGTDNTID